jgi:hypothetical protein
MPPSLLLAVAIAGLCVHTIAIAAVIWRGGIMVGRVNTTLERLAEEIRGLRTTRDEHIGVLARVVGQLVALESRVTRLEEHP